MEKLSWKQICARYPDEWVVLVDLVYENGDEDNGEIVSAIVLGHSKDRDSCVKETKPLRPPGTDCAFLYTGRTRAPPLPLIFYVR